LVPSKPQFLAHLETLGQLSSPLSVENLLDLLIVACQPTDKELASEILLKVPSSFTKVDDCFLQVLRRFIDAVLESVLASLQWFRLELFTFELREDVLGDFVVIAFNGLDLV
jgi:hypothetical protein